MSVQEILNKAKKLRGYNLEQLYHNLNLKAPDYLKKSKGHTGQLLEYYLGATAQSKPLPDFPELGLELKTIPIDINNKPLESTYICTAPVSYKPVDNKNIFNFEQSNLYQKIKLILWVPIIINHQNQNQTLNNTNIYKHRIIGPAFVWQPDEHELQLIKTDWLELTEMLILGESDKVSSHYGQVLQIRPKAANSKVTTFSTDRTGNITETLPRGFYLRANFTKNILIKNQ